MAKVLITDRFLSQKVFFVFLCSLCVLCVKVLRSSKNCHPERNDVERSETEWSRGTLRYAKMQTQGPSRA